MSTVEANLDDFFRKRDKKKKSSKSNKFSKIDNAELASHLDAVNSNNNLIDDEQQQQQQLNDNDTLAQSETLIANDTTTQAAVVAPAAPIISQTTTTSTKLVQNKLNDLNLNKNENIDDGDEEWKQFESDENKNYSGLKINFIKLRTQDSDEENNTEQNGEVEKKPNCPWLAKSTATATSTTTTTQNTKSNEDTDDNNDDNENKNDFISSNNKKINQINDDNNNTSNETSNNKTAASVAAAAPAGAAAPGAYVPPHLRHLQQKQTDKPAAATATTTAAAAPSTYVPPHLRGKTTTTSANDGFQSSSRRTNKNQPNIMDECEFPSLSDFKPTSNDVRNTSNANDSKFEQPKRSGKADQHNTPNTIDLENRYNALSS